MYSSLEMGAAQIARCEGNLYFFDIRRVVYTNISSIGSCFDIV